MRKLPFRFFASLAVFLGSYLPLGVILLVQDIDYGNYQPSCLAFWEERCGWLPNLQTPYFSLPIFIVSALCFIIAIYSLSSARPKNPINIKSSKYVPAELMSYTLPYVVSFMSLDYQQTGKFVGLIVFLLWMFWITHRSGQLLLNPIFIAFGWRLHEISFSFPGSDKIHQGRALSKGELRPDRQYAHTLIQDVMVVKGPE